MHNHCHQQTGSSLQMRFIWALLLNGGLAIGEIIASILTGSTALLADGLNNIDDVAALVLSIYSERISKKPPDERYTFGHDRIDIISGFAKGCFLLISAVLVIYQAIRFLITPDIIDGKIVMIVGAIALIVNILSAAWLKEDACHSLNAKGTYLCMVYDAVGSFAVMVSGFLSLFSNEFIYFDILASLLITAFMIHSGLGILKEAIRIFMQSTPNNFDFNAFESAIRSLDHVMDVGDIHVWSQSLQENHLTCKVNIEPKDACHCDAITRHVENICQTQFGIHHTTIQLVYDQANLSRFCKK